MRVLLGKRPIASRKSLPRAESPPCRLSLRTILHFLDGFALNVSLSSLLVDSGKKVQKVSQRGSPGRKDVPDVLYFLHFSVSFDRFDQFCQLLLPMKPAGKCSKPSRKCKTVKKVENRQESGFPMKPAGNREKTGLNSDIKQRKRAEMTVPSRPHPRLNRQESEETARKCRKSKKVKKGKKVTEC